MHFWAVKVNILALYFTLYIKLNCVYIYIYTHTHTHTHIGFMGLVQIALINTFAVSYNKNWLYILCICKTHVSLLWQYYVIKSSGMHWSKFFLLEETVCSNNPNCVCQFWMIGRIISVVKSQRETVCAYYNTVELCTFLLIRKENGHQWHLRHSINKYK